MQIKNFLFALMISSLILVNIPVTGQTPLWQGKGRIVMSSDGNEHDHDDWAATPLSLALLSAAGLQDKLVLYTFSNHIWGSSKDHPSSKSGLNAYEHMRLSALEGGKQFGFDKTRFICAVDNAEVAYNSIRDAINESTSENPLIIIEAGPMQVVGEGISRSDIKKRQFVSVISHSEWNNKHGDEHSGWTFKRIIDEFSNPAGGNLKCIQIADQNGGKNYDGLNAPFEKFDWIKSSKFRNNPAYKKGSWDWLYTRIETCIKEDGKNFDASDAGMIVYLLTGIDKTDPVMARKIMENPAGRSKK